jgi:hypothetical protein
MRPSLTSITSTMSIWSPSGLRRGYSQVTRLPSVPAADYQARIDGWLRPL